MHFKLGEGDISAYNRSIFFLLASLAD